MKSEIGRRRVFGQGSCMSSLDNNKTKNQGGSFTQLKGFVFFFHTHAKPSLTLTTGLVVNYFTPFG